jgi:acyl-coenzyme A synthetase/AMP-(fatty) acid ligase
MEAFNSLLEEAATSKLVAPSDAFPIVSTILKERTGMQRLVIPELGVLLDEKSVKNVPFKKSFEEYRMKPWMLLHTSGSTGIPKVITIRHGYACTIDAYGRFGSEVHKRSGNRSAYSKAKYAANYPL